MANQDIYPSNVQTENIPPSREILTLNDNSQKSKERNPQFIIKNANPNILIPISPSETGPKRILRPTPRSSIKKWNQLNIKQYDSKEAFIKVSPQKINIEELPKKKFKLITKIKMNPLKNAATVEKWTPKKQPQYPMKID